MEMKLDILSAHRLQIYKQQMQLVFIALEETHRAVGVYFLFIYIFFNLSSYRSQQRRGVLTHHLMQKT